jgi:FAD/FMN-containing dehydrogenase
MVDMRKLKGIDVHNDNGAMSMTIGTGHVWGEVLKYLRKIDSELMTVHGQCTSVGVAGFALHGGVHFGGLSELYGLASDNILGLTAVYICICIYIYIYIHNECIYMYLYRHLHI